MARKYPRLFKINNRKAGDSYYLCETPEEVLEMAMEEYKNLMAMGLLYDMDLPDENMYGEVTDEMIDNAPSSEVRSALERCRKNREVWLRGSWSKFNQENEYYHFYMEAEKGNKRGAYSYLREATKSLEELDISRAI